MPTTPQGHGGFAAGACAEVAVCVACCLQDGQEFLKLLLSKLEVVFAASQRQVCTLRPAPQFAPCSCCARCQAQGCQLVFVCARIPDLGTSVRHCSHFFD